MTATAIGNGRWSDTTLKKQESGKRSAPIPLHKDFFQSTACRVALGSVSDGIIATDTQGRITFINSVAESLTGWTMQEAIGDPIADVFCIINRTNRQRQDSPTSRASQEGVIVSLEDGTLLIAKGRSEWPIDGHAFPISNEKGEFAGCVLIFQDLTERQAQRQIAQDALAYADNIIATLREPFLVLDKHLRVLTANSSFYHSFQVNQEETEGRFIYDLGNGQWNIPRLRVLLEDILPQNHSFQDFDVEHDFPTIGPKVMELNARRVKRPGNNSELILLAIEDVTERRRMQDEQSRTANDLRQFAAEVSEAGRRKNEFLAMLAHELRNPLAPICTAIQVLRLTGNNVKAVHSASEMMERQIGQMVRLVDDLLDVSRLSLGKIELRKGRTNLTAVVNQAVEAAHSLVQCMDHKLVVTLPAEPIYLDADPARLAQVVGNLLSNACKFTDKGGHIWLTLEVENRDREQPEATIRVRENGIGIAADHLPRVFDMFKQIDISLERSTSGLGIGLTLVKNLVEMHGGTVEVQSAGVGQGSEFVVRLPLSVDMLAAQPLELPGNLAAVSMPRRILVVDDNRDSVNFLIMLLEMSGHEMHAAYDGLEAVEQAERLRPDLVLLDIGLPKLNGYEAARQIRKQAWGKDMLLIALTGWGQDEDRLRSREAGFDHHMVKPLELDALTELLDSLPRTIESALV